MNKSRLLGAVCAILFTLITVSANAALVGVLPATSGGMDWQAVYDDDLGISWVANANLAESNTFGVTGINADGSMDFSTANAYIIAMNDASYLGFSDWRLPTTLHPDATCSRTDNSSGTGCTGSEMGHLHNVEGIAEFSTAPFSNLYVVGLATYWSSTTSPDDSTKAYIYRFVAPSIGQGFGDKTTGVSAVWAVRDGDVSAVPVPAAVWLFGSGLIGLLGLARRKKA